MINNLVVVESPTKARTLARFLGDDYKIEASMGHIRDLPKSKIGVDESNFEPQYIVPKDKTKRANELKKLAAEAKVVWLATDPDREGEAISWHLATLLSDSKTKAPELKRVTFHEITEGAIKDSFLHPRNLDLNLVDAQQARRVLDRLVGYKLSPVLWKKVKSGLSAGRVQSVALRLIVEREEEVKAFVPVEYWSVEAKLETMRSGDKSEFVAEVVEVNGEKLEIKDKAASDTHVEALQNSKYQVTSVRKKEVKRYPYPPFTTSTLQQAASNRLGFTAKKTMMLAQNLYEQGLITYMRTDSLNLSAEAVNGARSYIQSDLGRQYLPEQPKYYKTRSKMAQEAHEAIRPTDVRILGAQINGQGGLTRDHSRLYDLIWKRMVASQMNEAIMDQTSIDISASSVDKKYLLRATGSIVKFDGWLKLYGVKVADEAEEEDKEDKENILPELLEGEDLSLKEILPEQHFTEPPPRYNEASLIKKLEELGIGRPSTYAPTLATIQERFYVERVERRFVPTELGIAVTKFLKDNFADVIDYSFTAKIEDEFDEVAEGQKKWKGVIEEFYTPFASRVGQVEERAERVKVETEVVNEKCPVCSKNLTIKFGRFGKFLACSGYPECKFTKPLTTKLDIKCPTCSGDVILRKTKKGRPFYGCSNYPKCKFASWTKPKGKKTEDSKSED